MCDFTASAGIDAAGATMAIAPLQTGDTAVQTQAPVRGVAASQIQAPASSAAKVYAPDSADAGLSVAAAPRAGRSTPYAADSTDGGFAAIAAARAGTDGPAAATLAGRTIEQAPVSAASAPDMSCWSLVIRAYGSEAGGGTRTGATGAVDLAYASRGRWLYPLLELLAMLEAEPMLLAGAVRLEIFDRVTGRAAALLLVHLQEKHLSAGCRISLSTGLMSDGAMRLLSGRLEGISLKKRVPSIGCATEELLADCIDPEAACTMLKERVSQRRRNYES